MIFVIGTGRCGTKTFNKLLCDAGIDSSHELGDLERWSASVLPCTLYPIRPKFARPLLVELLRNLRGEAHVNHHFGRIIPLIDEVCLDAKFVWLVRDARPCVASMASCPNWFNYDRAPWERWNIRGHWTGEMTRDEWEALTKVGRCAWNYVWQNGLIEKSLAGIDHSRWRRFRMESFSSHGAVREVLEWCGARKIPLEVPHENANPRKSAWSEQEESEFKRFCEPSEEDESGPD